MPRAEAGEVYPRQRDKGHQAQPAGVQHRFHRKLVEKKHQREQQRADGKQHRALAVQMQILNEQAHSITRTIIPCRVRAHKQRKCLRGTAKPCTIREKVFAKDGMRLDTAPARQTARILAADGGAFDLVVAGDAGKRHADAGAVCGYRHGRRAGRAGLRRRGTDRLGHVAGQRRVLRRRHRRSGGHLPRAGRKGRPHRPRDGGAVRAHRPCGPARRCAP